MKLQSGLTDAWFSEDENLHEWHLYAASVLYICLPGFACTMTYPRVRTIAAPFFIVSLAEWNTGIENIL